MGVYNRVVAALCGLICVGAKFRDGQHRGDRALPDGRYRQTSTNMKSGATRSPPTMNVIAGEISRRSIGNLTIDPRSSGALVKRWPSPSVEPLCRSGSRDYPRNALIRAAQSVASWKEETVSGVGVDHGLSSVILLDHLLHVGRRGEDVIRSVADESRG